MNGVNNAKYQYIISFRLVKPMKRIRFENGTIDEMDATILSILSRDARVSMAELARLLGVSPPTAAERVKRLEEAGIIEGYSARINPAAIGRPITAWLRIRPVPGQLQRVAKVIDELPELVQCDRVTGDDCFVARAHVPSMRDLERLIDKIIPYAMTNTAVVQSSPITPRMPPLPVPSPRLQRLKSKERSTSEAGPL